MGAVARLLEELLKNGLGDGEVDVDADEVHQLKRTHLESSFQAYDSVDLFHRCYLISQEPERLAVERSGDPVHNEAGGVAADNRGLLHLRGDTADLPDR